MINNRSIKSLDVSTIELVRILSKVLGGFANQQLNLGSLDARKEICNKFYDALVELEEVRDAR